MKGVKALGEVLLNDKENITVREQVAMALAGTNRPEAHALLLRTMETAPARLQTIIALGLADSRREVRSCWMRSARARRRPGYCKTGPLS